ncbi:MazG family protein [Sanguibacter suaedae]|uniref:MazG family protein n=1 Tax=Sanguibacter suaedae TaxID=2795737 RepID=A0A934IA34_9MICO|nr:MazG family protein [Sanguibacter suaedae]MBI9114682.1 MazG family protein [Sanguibacter suaedae]
MTDPLRHLVDVMDRLRSPGGCPWDADQTHESLVRYALEETYELVEAVETGDRAGMREELGDVLLQVVFNARVASEHPDEPFGIDEVASDLAAKLVRRHPHVFGDDEYVDHETLRVSWDAIKREEKGRASVLEGIPLAQGALSRAQKVVSRAERLEGTAGPAVPEPVGDTPGAVADDLLALVRRAHALGVDAEGALRERVRALEAEVRTLEAGTRPEESPTRGPIGQTS